MSGARQMQGMCCRMCCTHGSSAALDTAAVRSMPGAALKPAWSVVRIETKPCGWESIIGHRF